MHCLELENYYFNPHMLAIHGHTSNIGNLVFSKTFHLSASIFHTILILPHVAYVLIGIQKNLFSNMCIITCCNHFFEVFIKFNSSRLLFICSIFSLTFVLLISIISISLYFVFLPQ